ncbi:LysR family transcriptional regulator [Caballeronia terrestris]|jgi:molybdate transport repressor ModE-like protein|uniref:LysR family transcriptional regulator n=1 Tax=Caballeronia terrestris TaxID=1226301 RepID=A0A158IYH5_9BURK|nr:LysR family transcriptional regulator [Caballeronia terrestris]SAL61648.1 LysR family transcriptional regulator [Caballeronia terrestris]
MQKSINLDPSKLNWDDLRYFLEVARTQRASGAAKRLGVDYTTVARRVRALEDALGTLLFDKSRSGGFVLTAEGQRLLGYVDAIETTVQSATEQIANTGHALSGHVRVGSTEGFGCFFLAPQLARFQDTHPNITIDLLPVPHFVSLSKREADIAVTLERPEQGQYVYTKLCDYRLKLYATADYLARHAPIASADDLRGHHFASYIDDLAFSYELLYLERAVPGAQSRWRSTSVIAQYFAALQGRALAILPCFMAAQDERLVPVLPDEIVVTRAFYLSCREDLRKLKRITTVWDYLRSAAEGNRAFLMGDGDVMQWVETGTP